MKRFIFALMMLAATISCAAESKTVNSVISIVNEYSSDPDIDVISIGKLGIDIVTVLGKLSVETKEEKDVVALLSGFSKILVADYEDAEISKRQEINSKLTKALEGAEKIIEVKDEEDTVLVYGTSVNDGEKLEDIIIYIPEDCALICFVGSIDFDKLTDLVKATDESI